ncbi:MAG: UDP-N-acetylmuramoyl-L-alanyl-D-glutamate--2,6-diaminopimelate ligase [Chlorobiaceae bacterium]
MTQSDNHSGRQAVMLDGLLGGITAISRVGEPAPGQTVSMVTSDSREVTPGALFVAIRGYSLDGHRFISAAIKLGAVAVVTEELPPDVARGVIYIVVADSRRALAEASRLFFESASDRLMIVGVTGTNGKTTTARLITAMLNACGIPAGYIGTNLCIIGDRKIPLDRTTPEAHGLHALFGQMVDAGCRAAVMEVSSHALMLQRVYGIGFSVALFTNLSMEHLDFHGTMQEYALAKERLFDQLTPDGFAVFNADDPMAGQMAERVPPERRFLCTMQGGVLPDVACRSQLKAEIISETLESSTIRLHFPDRQVMMDVGLPGAFNVMNVLEAAATGFGLGLAPDDICRALAEVSAVDGRMERVGRTASGAHLFVDYAHTPDALFKALGALRALKPEGGRLVVVFGCGGNRDRSKRPEMGRIASEVADEVIITSDNPRDEDPEAILDEICSGIRRGRCRRVTDRAEAIGEAVQLLREGDVLLVAGKGHEKYQEISGRKEYFSDQDQLRKHMQEKECGR